MSSRAMACTPPIDPVLRAFIDRAVVPALLERFLRDQSIYREGVKVYSAEDRTDRPPRDRLERETI